MTYTGIGSRQKPSLRHEWKAERKKAAMLWGGGQRSCCRERDGTEEVRGEVSHTLTDSGALMNTLLLPSWNWSLSMLTDCSKWRTPCFSSPFHEGQVALVRMAYL